MATWSEGGSMSAGRTLAFGFGTLLAGVAAGGNGALTASEEYDGTSWSSGGALTGSTNYGSPFSAGTLTAGMFAGGKVSNSPSNATEEYDGTTFTVGGTLAQVRGNGCGMGGSQTAAFITGGHSGSANLNTTEEYDGTSWSGGGNIATARRDMGSAGTLTSGLIFCGYSTTQLNSTEEYDGTSWSGGGAVTDVRYNTSNFGSSGTNALLVSGLGKTDTQLYDGTSWSSSTAIPAAHDAGSCGGTALGGTGFVAGGSGVDTTQTYEWSDVALAFKGSHGYIF